MGAISAIIDKQDSADKMLAAAKQMIQIGKTMIETRFKIFQQELNVSLGQILKFPGKYLITSSKKVALNFSKNQESLKNDVKGIVESFVQGNILEGIVNLLLAALDAIMGSFTASYNQSQDYVVIVNPMGGVFRIDYLVVQQKITAQGITDKVQDIFGSYLIVSSVKKEDIKDDNAFRVIVNRQFPTASLSQQFLILKLVKAEEVSQDLIKQIENLPPEPPKSKFKQLHFTKKPLEKAETEAKPQEKNGHFFNGEE